MARMGWEERNGNYYRRVGSCALALHDVGGGASGFVAWSVSAPGAFKVGRAATLPMAKRAAVQACRRIRSGP